MRKIKKRGYKRAFKNFIYLIALLCAAFFILSGCQKDAARVTATVDRVIDGDTLRVNIDGEVKTIRLLLVDTPESVHPTKPVQPFGIEASSFVKKLLPAGTKVEVEYDKSKEDKYGRLLAYIWLDDKMLNETLLEEGYARVAYVYEPNTKYVEEFRDIEDETRKKKIGIWSLPNYVTDTGFNSNVQTQAAYSAQTHKSSCTKPSIKGNITRNGEKIYHTPDSPQYDATKPEKMFCTEEDAIKAGFRKPKSA
jgi:micrococcal nuclease